MSVSLPLPGLSGANPVGFLAALGVLDVVTRAGLPARLNWTDALVPLAVLEGVRDLEELVALVRKDRAGWADSLVLRWPEEQPLPDVKPSPDELHRWMREVEAAARPGDRRDADLLAALLAEGAEAGKGDAKPTALHFTAGRQLFLVMVRTLQKEVSDDDVREALAGPWRYRSALPSLGWDNSRGERIYALRGADPAGEKRLGVPGADWLAFLGLTFLPVAAAGTALRTTRCEGRWKDGALSWPLWGAFLTPVVVRSLLLQPRLDLLSPTEAARQGLLGVRRAPIRRSDQGGYGSFGPSTFVVDATTSR